MRINNQALHSALLLVKYVYWLQGMGIIMNQLELAALYEKKLALLEEMEEALKYSRELFRNLLWSREDENNLLTDEEEA